LAIRKSSQLLGHFNTISGNLEIVSANSAAMSGDMRLAVHRLAQPPSKWHTLARRQLYRAEIRLTVYSMNSGAILSIPSARAVDQF